MLFGILNLIQTSANLRSQGNSEVCGTQLPWKNKVKHLGNSISNNMDLKWLNMRINAVKYVEKSTQKFSFLHPKVKSNIYNGLYGTLEIGK